MKERPMLFSGEMARALLDGRKTQTRRLMKPQPEPTPNDYTGPAGHWWPSNEVQSMVHVERELQNHDGGWEGLAGTVCPYGEPGDRLWVRETWGVISHYFDSHGNLVDWEPDRPATRIHEMQFGRGYYSGHVVYAADGYVEWAGDDDGMGEPRSAWKPSIHMPRLASRITLEIVSVRVERLQEISEADAAAEGARCADPATGREVLFDKRMGSYRLHFRSIWETINGPGSWDANPWVWVVEFKRVEQERRAA